jgi:hypothetical protein
MVKVSSSAEELDAEKIEVGVAPPVVIVVTAEFPAVIADPVITPVVPEAAIVAVLAALVVTDKFEAVLARLVMSTPDTKV